MDQPCLQTNRYDILDFYLVVARDFSPILELNENVAT